MSNPIDFPSPTNYQEKGHERKKLIEKIKLDKENELKQELANMSLIDHLSFIKSIMNAFVGARSIRIYYGLPMSIQIKSELANALKLCLWKVGSSDGSHPFQLDRDMVIHNYEDNELNYLSEVFIRPGYNSSTTTTSNTTTSTSTSTSESVIERFHLYSEYIGVDLNGVFIPSKYMMLSDGDLKRNVE